MRPKLNGRIARGDIGRRTPADIDGYANNSVAVPVGEDGRVICLKVADAPPARPGAFRDVTASYVAPETILDSPPRVLVRQLAEQPSLIVLRRLLAAATFDEVTPLEFAAEWNLLEPPEGC